MSDDTLAMIEKAVQDMLTAFDIDHPPIPVELMLQRPRENMWSEIDLAEMSATFLTLHDRYAPRMSVVRLLARNIVRSDWGKQRGLDALIQESSKIAMLARAIIIPRQFLESGDVNLQDLMAVSNLFEVPEEDITLRLEDLGYDIIDEE